MGTNTLTSFIGLSLMLVAACGGGMQTEGDQGAASESCLPGSVYSCARWNCSGFQRCADDGSRFLPCECNSADADDALVDAGTGKPMMTGTKPPTAAGRSDAGAIRTTDSGTSTPAQDAGRSRNDAGEGDASLPDASVPAERCDNGRDDDADGLTDCADPDCTETRCIPAAPDGWRGPVAWRAGAEAGSCSGELDRLVFEAGDQPEAEPAACSTCSCTGGACSTFLEFGTSTGAACGGESCTTSVNASCVVIRPSCLQGATTASLRTTLPSGGGCVPAQQEPTVPPAAWRTHVTACEPSDPRRSGCESGSVCLPTHPSDGFEPSYCIWREGNHPCDDATFPRQRVYYRELADTRTCSDCSCAAVGCNYSWQVYNHDDLSCTTPLLQLSSADQCAQINPEGGSLRVGATITGTGSCAATGGEPQGTVTAEDPITMCCTD